MVPYDWLQFVPSAAILAVNFFAERSPDSFGTFFRSLFTVGKNSSSSRSGSSSSGSTK